MSRNDNEEVMTLEEFHEDIRNLFMTPKLKQLRKDKGIGETQVEEEPDDKSETDTDSR